MFIHSNKKYIERNMYLIDPYRYAAPLPFTSYTNPGGSGDRVSTIPLIVSAPLKLGSGATLLGGGRRTGGDAYGGFWWNGNAAGAFMLFDFGIPKVINEMTWYQNYAESQGVWQWQGSNDAVSFENIGQPFILADSSISQNGDRYLFSVDTSMSSNIKAFRYYKAIGISGDLTWDPYLNEIEFKISL